LAFEKSLFNDLQILDEELTIKATNPCAELSVEAKSKQR
jgi:hypothetical protein